MTGTTLPPLPSGMHFFPGDAAEDDPELIRHVSGVGPAARDIAAAFTRDAAPVLSDEDLTERGQRKRLADVAKPHLRTLEQQRSMIDRAASELRDAASAMNLTLANAARPGPVEAALAIELRATLRTMDPERRQKAVMEAINNGQERMLRAIVGGLPEQSGLQHARGGLFDMVKDALVRLDGHKPETLARHARTIDAARHANDAARAFIRAQFDDGGAT